jgi:hypothetical protein
MYIIHEVYCSVIVLISGCITLRWGEHPWNFVIILRGKYLFSTQSQRILFLFIKGNKEAKREITVSKLTTRF